MLVSGHKEAAGGVLAAKAEVLSGAFGLSIPTGAFLKLLTLLMAGHVTIASVTELFFEANDNSTVFWDDDQQCGICGHFCPLSSGPLNFCMCWETIMTGGGCSCLACAH